MKSGRKWETRQTRLRLKQASFLIHFQPLFIGSLPSAISRSATSFSSFPRRRESKSDRAALAMLRALRQLRIIFQWLLLLLVLTAMSAHTHVAYHQGHTRYGDQGKTAVAFSCLSYFVELDRRQARVSCPVGLLLETASEKFCRQSVSTQ
jgi:hypothetical protein